jgi:hypothetical protein
MKVFAYSQSPENIDKSENTTKNQKNNIYYYFFFEFIPFFLGKNEKIKKTYIQFSIPHFSAMSPPISSLGNASIDIGGELCQNLL